MNKNSITQKQVDEIFENSLKLENTVFEKCFFVVCQLPNGFIITESSACVDIANYDEKIGREICYDRIINKIWELEGYKLQDKISNKNMMVVE